MKRTVSCVADSPCEKAFEGEHVWRPLIQALAEECPTCHEVAAREFPLFKEKLLKIVTDIVNSVRIHSVDRLVIPNLKLTVRLTD